MSNKFWAIDVGNTHTKIGIIENQKVLDVFRFRTDKEHSVDEYYFWLKSISNEGQTTYIPPICVASVVPAVTIALERLAQTRKLKVAFIDPSCDFSFTIDPAIGNQIGADILVLAEAAVRLMGEEVIIVSAGTATTVFAIQKSVLIGGAIAPGIKGSVESLIQNAALLPTVFLDVPTKAIGQNTASAMQSGILYGFAGLIDGLVAKMKDELENPNMPVIASGGMISKVDKISKQIKKVYPDLAMQGIAYLAEKVCT